MAFGRVNMVGPFVVVWSGLAYPAFMFCLAFVQSRAKRRVFFSFHYERDAWRAAQVRNAGILEGNTPVTPNSWENIKRGGDQAIQQWIEQQFSTRSCAVVLVGTHTAERRWVSYEIDRAWQLGKGIVGVCIHQLQNQDGLQSSQGGNPFIGHSVLGANGLYYTMDSVVRSYIVSSSNNQAVYSYIVSHLEDWVEEAIGIRNGYPR